jgi:predicted nucleic-acid-binding Zn-ribbon protein
MTDRPVYSPDNVDIEAEIRKMQSSMTDRFIFTRHRTNCYHCGVVADQIIKAVPYQAQVACANCGATRVFVPRIEDVAKPGSFTKIGCYDLWELMSEAPCRNCHVTGPHDLAIGCHHFTVRCRNCGFTHFYKFDVEYMARCPIGQEGSPAG